MSSQIEEAKQLYSDSEVVIKCEASKSVLQSNVMVFAEFGISFIITILESKTLMYYIYFVKWKFRIFF